MYGSGYADSASGFSTNVGYAVNGGSDAAYLFDSPGSNTYTAYADYNNGGKPLASMSGGSYSNSANGFRTNVGYAVNGSSDGAYLYDSPGNDTFYASANYNNSGKPLASMSGAYGGGYSNSAIGFGTSVGYSTNGGTDTADLVGSSGNNALYTDLAIAELYGSNFLESVSGFEIVDAFGVQGAVNTKGEGPVDFDLSYFGTWVNGN
jgi:hypothetical protein